MAHPNEEIVRSGSRQQRAGVPHVDGKVTEQWLHPGDGYAADVFWND
jgi:hypothetical protein